MDVSNISSSRQRSTRLPISADSSASLHTVGSYIDNSDNSDIDYSDADFINNITQGHLNALHNNRSEYSVNERYPCSELSIISNIESKDNESEKSVDKKDKMDKVEKIGWIEYEEFPISSNGDHGKPINLKDKLINYCRVEKNDKQNQFNDSLFDIPLPSNNEMFGISNQPCEKYDNGLKVIDSCKMVLRDINLSCYYKNNLSTCYINNGVKWLFVISNDTNPSINIYDLNQIDKNCNFSDDEFEPQDDSYFLIGKIYLSQETPLSMHILRECIDPRFPHNVNYITIGKINLSDDNEYTKNKVEDDAVLITVDDAGFVKFFNINELIEMYNNKSLGDLRSMNNLVGFDHFKIDFFSGENYFSSFYNTKKYKTLHVTSSGWNLKICNKKFIIISSNAQRITVFNLKTGECFNSEKLNHNIPSLDTISINNEKIDEFFITCGTYNGNLLLIYFNSKNENNENFQIVDSIIIKSHIWITEFIQNDIFLKVKKTKDISGDFLFDNKRKLDLLFRNSNILDPNFKINESNINNFEIAGKLIKLNIPSLQSRRFSNDIDENKPLVDIKDETIRMEKIYKNWLNKNKRKYAETDEIFKKFNNLYIFTSTDLSIGMFTFYELFNINTCSTVFPIVLNPRIIDDPNKMIYNQPLPGFNFLNRIYLKLLIPELECIVVGTQAGQIAIFRFTEFRGVKSMRLELVLVEFVEGRGFDNPLTIVGLNGSKCGYNDNMDPIWLINVIFSSGVIYSYKITK